MKIVRLVFTIALLLMIAAAPVAAGDSSSSPLLPEQFYGTITAEDGTPAPVGTILTAELNGEKFTIKVTEAGTYGGKDRFTPNLLVSDSTDGGTISFHAGSVTAEKTDTYTPGNSTKLDLVFSSFPADSMEVIPGGSTTTTTISYERVNPGTGVFSYMTTDGQGPLDVNQMTVFGALYASSHSIETTIASGSSIGVTSIDGNRDDPPNGWMYYINDRDPSVYSNECPVSNGDKIVWWYSNSPTCTVATSPVKYGLIIDTSLIPAVPPTTNTTQVTIPPAEIIIPEIKPADATGYVTLEVTATIRGVQLPEATFTAHPEAFVKVVEGNSEPVTMPAGIKADEVQLILEISVQDKDGKEIDVDTEGHFDISVIVPAGKLLAVGHLKQSGTWENCPVELLDNGQWRVTYSSLSPFAICFLDEGKENPFVAAETATPTETPTPTETVPVTNTPTVTPSVTPDEPETSAEIPVWVFIIGGVVIVLIVAGAVVLSRRR